METITLSLLIVTYSHAINYIHRKVTTHCISKYIDSNLNTHTQQKSDTHTHTFSLFHIASHIQIVVHKLVFVIHVQSY